MVKDEDSLADIELSTGRPVSGSKKGSGKIPKSPKSPKASASKSSDKSSGGLAAGLKAASRAGGKSKISAKIPRTAVKSGGGAKKAPNMFPLPKTKPPSTKSMKRR